VLRGIDFTEGESDLWRLHSARGWRLRRSSRIASWGVTCGILDAKRRIVPGGSCGIPPEARNIVYIVEGIVDPTISSFVAELKRDPRLIPIADLVLQIEAREVDPHAGICARRKGCCHLGVFKCGVYVLHVEIESFSRIQAGSAIATRRLHGSGCRTSAYYDGVDARLCRHELNEVSACRGAKTIRKLVYF
jgi:hypothetical protein